MTPCYLCSGERLTGLLSINLTWLYTWSNYKQGQNINHFVGLLYLTLFVVVLTIFEVISSYIKMSHIKGSTKYLKCSHWVESSRGVILTQKRLFLKIRFDSKYTHFNSVWVHYNHNLGSDSWSRMRDRFWPFLG